ncbi:MAG: DNA cytosine methyltransferase [Firmicutes bacterium]|nr:DNA cytosine methyltransferase [Bacillota bacterium]
MKNSFRVVSLFDGISCGRVALDRAGIAVCEYQAYEIDKYAIAISRYNYPDIVQNGDVLTDDFSRFAGYDLVMGGSPCTFWSIAKANREIDKDGCGWRLFMRFVEAVRQIKPRFFLYENVASMPQNIKEYISEELGVQPILINSALVSAQHRKRLYWTNIPGVEPPADRGILLRDIIDSGMACRDKSYCIDANYFKGGSKKRLDNQSGKRQMVYEQVAAAEKANAILSSMHRENTLSMLKRGKTGLFSCQQVDDFGAALRTREDEAGRFKRLEVRGDGKLNSLTTTQTDSVVCSPVRVGEFASGGQGNRVYSVHGKTVALMAQGGGRGGKVGLYKIDLPDGDYTIRKLTPVEAERCQTLPDNYTALGADADGNTVKISNTQRYKCVGNGWTVDAIAHILRHIETGGGL